MICAFFCNLFFIPAVSAQTATTRALQEIEKKNWGEAYTFVSKAQNPVLTKIYAWKYLQTEDSNADFKRLSTFIRNNPNWPELNKIRMQLEYKVDRLTPDTEIIKWFDEYPPLTAEGIDQYAQSLLRQNLKSKLKTTMGDWWATTFMSREEQKEIYGKYKNYIPLQAHRRRFDRLLLKKHYRNARAVAKVLGHGYSELAEARIALAEQKPGVNEAVSKVPANLQRDPGLLYERLRWRRRNDLNQEAIEILKNPPAVETIINPKDWWRERHIIIRRLLEQGDDRAAYQLASEHIQKEGFPYAQAEWMAGWLALRFVFKPSEAYQRFETLHGNVKTPVSKARAAYWSGRAAESMKDTELAKQWYNNAAQYQTVFYGQKAGEKIGLRRALQNAKPPVLTFEQQTAFQKNELIQAAKLYHTANFEKQTSQFLWKFVKVENTAIAYKYAIEVALKMKRYHDVISIAKSATQNGHFLTLQSYPTMKYALKKAHKSVEPALVHALMRQESQFNASAKSPAGALGLMQLMPATARQVAREIGIGHQTSWLTQNPVHNVQLGSQYMADLLERYDGEYILAIAAYNAGPGRIDRWIKTYGHPKDAGVDPLDWGELIPIYETRNYVQRVMEGVYVYRLLLK